MNQFLKFGLIFLLSYTFFLVFLPKPENIPQDQFILKGEQEFSIGNLVSIELVNNTKENIIFKNSCPNSPLRVEFFDFGEKKEISKNIKTEDCKSLSVKTGERKMFDFGGQNVQLFQKVGDYKIVLEDENNGKTYEKSFKITPQGFFSKIWDGVFYKPLYNFLIRLIDVLPFNSLALAIIILTIMIKLALLLPNHKALKNQKELQKIQPKLEEIKKKFAGDQAKIAQETMKLWKTNGVNPMGSCLPILIQFPFLIAIFYIIKDGLTENNSYLLYSFISNFDYAIINSNFLGLFDLADSGVILLALFVGIAQYWQMELTFKNQTPATGNDFMAIQMKMMSKMMKYIMPVMIAIFTFIMPAGLGIYWLVSTLFAAVQQLYVNNSNSKGDSNGKNSGKKNKNKNISDAVIVNKKDEKKGVTVIDA